MILTKEVEVKVNSNTVEYYKSLGYEIPIKKASKSYFNKTGKEFVYDFNKTIVVNVNDLQQKSNIYVDVLCDMCKNEVMSVRYADYNKVMNQSGSYVCKGCSYIKGMQTNISRYGKLYFETDDFKEKRSVSMKNKYGVEHYLQDERLREKYHETCMIKYGENYSKLFHKKAQETFQKKTGYVNPAQSPEVKEKTRQTNLQKYGVPNTMQAPEVRAKANETLCKNGTQKTSHQQLYLHSLYGGKINYPISYYAVDICFPEEKLIVEYDGGGHDLRVTLGRLTQEEFDKKEIIRNSVLKHEGYKQMRIISKTDKLPSDSTLFQMLSEAKQYFSDYPEHSWVEYNLDTLTMRNAEHKDGVFYNYGELRQIK